MPVLQGSEQARHPRVRINRVILMHLSRSHASRVGIPGSARLSQRFWGTLKVRRKVGEWLSSGPRGGRAGNYRVRRAGGGSCQGAACFGCGC